MKKSENNFSFIDGHNLYLGIKNLGWPLDWKRFRIYLKEKYGATRVYLFIGYISENKIIYDFLKKCDYILVFKPTTLDENGKIKGNVDADLVLQTMIEFKNFDQAIIISSDGDFYSLVSYLRRNDKLKIVISPYTKTCSILLKKEAGAKIDYMQNLRKKLEYKKKSTA